MTTTPDPRCDARRAGPCTTRPKGTTMTDDLLNRPALPPFVPDAPRRVPWWRRALLTAIDVVHPRTAIAMLPVDADPYQAARLR